MRARRQWPMGLAMSWSAKEIQIFSPVKRQPSNLRVARVRKRPSSDPAPGSEIAMVAARSPRASAGTQPAARSGAQSVSRCAAKRLAPGPS